MSLAIWDHNHNTVHVFSYNNIAGESCTAGDLSMNSKCYRKFDHSRTWFAASNDCLSRGGSLAVFADIGRPSDNTLLTEWLNATGTDKTYWIGLVRSWWNTTDEGILSYYRRILVVCYFVSLCGFYAPQYTANTSPPSNTGR